MLAIDHVILVVEDLEQAAAAMVERYGLEALPGGRHHGHGTANRIIPLGDSYVELMGVVDPAEAATSPMGRWALANATPDLVPRALCLRTEDISTVAQALGEAPLTMDRIRPDGLRLAWRMAGLGGMLDEGRPFFIEWEVTPADHPGAATAQHRIDPTGISRVVMGTVVGPVARIVAGVPGVTITRFRPGVRWVEIGAEGGPIRLG